MEKKSKEKRKRVALTIKNKLKVSKMVKKCAKVFFNGSV